MTRFVGNAQSEPGSIDVRSRIDLSDVDVPERLAELHRLGDLLDPGAEVEIVLADLGDDEYRLAAVTLAELIAGGIHLHLRGRPEQVQHWLLAMRGPGA